MARKQMLDKQNKIRKEKEKQNDTHVCLCADRTQREAEKKMKEACERLEHFCVGAIGGHGLHIYLNSASVYVCHIKSKLSLFLILPLCVWVLFVLLSLPLSTALLLLLYFFHFFFARIWFHCVSKYVTVCCLWPTSSSFSVSFFFFFS